MVTWLGVILVLANSFAKSRATLRTVATNWSTSIFWVVEEEFIMINGELRFMG